MTRGYVACRAVEGPQVTRRAVEAGGGGGVMWRARRGWFAGDPQRVAKAGSDEGVTWCAGWRVRR